MHLTLVHPCIGRRAGQPYIRTWQMEPLPPAAIAGLTPNEVSISFYDDRMEAIPFDQPTDLAAISVETYTAKRAYQIASEYRKRNVPVVMGGFHATLCPQEAAQYAEAVVIGEAETLWERVLADAQKGGLQTYYRQSSRPSLQHVRVDRSIYAGKRYLPIGLIEAGRGCEFQCNFCAVQTVFGHSQTRRPTQDILTELEGMGRRPLIFFVDDNLTADISAAKEFFKALIPLKLRWVSQVSINAAFDEDLLSLMKASGCQAVLIGFESLNPENLKKMNKSINLMRGGFEAALANLRRHKIKLYITFVFGYDQDTLESFDASVDFALRHKFYIAAFNHLTPFPGTPLYRELQEQGRLLYEAWWLDDRYRYNQVPFQPIHMTPEQIQRGCVNARARFYQWKNIWNRGLDPVNRANLMMWLQFYSINALFRGEVSQRDDYPLGDENWHGALLKVRQDPPPVQEYA
ncbi:MAG: radical SAM protein [Anaerolineales bacterium]|nr:radical SAM protein [Anaerolineales bacterium]